MLIYLRYLSFKTILARKRQNGQIGRNGSMCKIKHCVVSVFILLDYVMAILSISASISWLLNPGLGGDIKTFNSIIEYVLFIYSAIPFGSIAIKLFITLHDSAGCRQLEIRINFLCFFGKMMKNKNSTKMAFSKKYVRKPKWAKLS